MSMKILLTETNAGDEILIRTDRSEYRFCVTNPVSCFCVPTGGVLGPQNHESDLTRAEINRPNLGAAPLLLTIEDT